MRFFKRTSRAKKTTPNKERWCYVGRAKLRCERHWVYWVYLHPTDDSWWFVDKRLGQAYDMGGREGWWPFYDFQDLTGTTLDNNPLKVKVGN